MRKTISEYIWVFAVILGISAFFYPTIWRQILVPTSNSELVIQGETPVYEFVAETVRQNILSLRNPYAETEQVLYPVGWKFALDDVAPINGLYFVLLRPFLTIHQSLMVIVLGSVFISGLSMYALLKLLKINGIVAFVSALIFCFTPFVSERIGAHPTYVALYLFTLPAIFFVKLIGTTHKKYLMAALLGISVALSFLTNLYFAVMLVLMISILIAVYAIFYFKETINLAISNLKYFALSVITMLLVLFPWVKEVLDVIVMGTIDKPSDWNDIQMYSADLTNVFIPSHFNPTYYPIVSTLGSQYGYIRSSFETFIYPGLLLIILTAAYLFLSKKINKYLIPVYVTAIVFLVMSFGPYLQIFGNNLSIPLPYILIPYIPLIQMARAPARFIVVFIFLSTIVGSLVLQYLYSKYGKGKWQTGLAVGIIFVVFILDQRTVIPAPTSVNLPVNIYNYLSKQADPTPLLEIPFVVRDSIKYFGYMNSHYATYVTLLHHRPIFGIYAGRVPNNVFSYFTNNPVLGPIGNIIDVSIANPRTELSSTELDSMINGINFYKIRHVVTKDNEVFSPTITSLLEKIRYKVIMNDQMYSLWEREPANITVDKFDDAGPYDQFSLTSGWSKYEVGESGRWAVGRRSELLFWLDDRNKKQFVIEAESIVKPQKVQVYVNNIKIGTIIVSGSGYNRYSLPISNQLNIGRNTLIMQFANTHKLSKIFPESKDERSLALHVKYIGLE